MTDLLERWLEELIATPGLTSIRDFGQARRMLLEDSLRGVELIRRFDGPIIDVGSGGGAPGIPLAAALPAYEVTLLEANGRKCEFLRRWMRELPNLRVEQGRAEEQPLELYALAVAKALAPPPVAAEWCLPLVVPGGGVILWVGPTADLETLGRVAERLAAEIWDAESGIVVLHKLAPTPPGFPRRVGVARKRPLA